MELSKDDFEFFETDFSNRILNGFTTEYAVYEVTRKYRKYVMEQFFK